MFGGCTFWCNTQNLCNFRDNRGCECRSLVCEKCCRYERMFRLISLITFATLIADASVRGHAKKYREKTSMAVRTFSYAPLKGRFGNMSICKASSGQRSHSGKSSSSGVIVALGTRLSCAHCSHTSTHSLTCLAMLG